MNTPMVQKGIVKDRFTVMDQILCAMWLKKANGPFYHFTTSKFQQTLTLQQTLSANSNHIENLNYHQDPNLYPDCRK